VLHPSLQRHCLVVAQDRSDSGVYLGVPIKRATIAFGDAHVHCGRYSIRDADAADRERMRESICLFYLSGAAAEELAYGNTTVGSDAHDIERVRAHLAPRIDALWIGSEIERLRDGARRLVRDANVSHKIRIIRDGLLRRDMLSADEVIGLVL
jgi:hypothetical protein